MSATLLERLYRLTDMPAEGCWNWLGCRTDLGYGRIRNGSRPEGAHRVSYRLHVGEIPTGMVIDHLCHNPACVRPEHLRLATSKQNNENQTRDRGVCWHPEKQKWRAYVQHFGRQHFAGYFDDRSDAAAVARALRNSLFTHNDSDRYGFAEQESEGER